MEYQAVWQDQVLARSAETIVVEGNRYFPAESVNREYLEPSAKRSLCFWKGLASYYTVTVDGVENKDAAWVYPRPTFLATRVKNRVAFWSGIVVEPVQPESDSVRQRAEGAS